MRVAAHRFGSPLSHSLDLAMKCVRHHSKEIVADRPSTRLHVRCGNEFGELAVGENRAHGDATRNARRAHGRQVLPYMEAVRLY